MKKLTDIEIYNRFREVCPAKSNWISYYQNLNLIKLDGTFVSDELREIARVMDEIYKGTPQDREIDRVKTLEVKGFKSSDVKVTYSNGHEDSKKYWFSFYIMKDGVDYDFYYGKSDGGAGDWWPAGEDEYDISPIHQFIPKNFWEDMENAYNYSGTNGEAIEFLKACGFEVVKGDDFF